jgi:hypothetical protein
MALSSSQDMQNVVAVVREALRLLEERDQTRSAQTEAFNQELSQRIASLDRGEHVDPEASQRALQERDAGIERWLQDDVAAAFDLMQASLERAIPAKAAFAAVRSRHAERAKHSG